MVWYLVLRVSAMLSLVISDDNPLRRLGDADTILGRMRDAGFSPREVVALMAS